MSAILAPINALLRKDTVFDWSEKCEASFNKVKNVIISPKVLMPYDPKMQLVMATDASPEGLGAVISHRMPDNSERPIAFASRSLSKSEKNYSQIDREATAIFWGLKKFFQYCYGRKFILVTDNKPLLSILHPHKTLPATSAIRLLHYATFMTGFDYSIEYRNTTLHGNADYLSRTALIMPRDVVDSNHIFLTTQLDTLPVTRKEIKRETSKDLECVRIYHALTEGKHIPNEDMTRFSLHDGCVFNGIRIMIPVSLRPRILEELHVAHFGMVKMKSLARSFVWWRGIDVDIENIARSCRSCALIRREEKPLKVHPWEFPKFPWQRLHLDYAGPFMNKYFLIVVDAHTKYLEVVPTDSMTSKVTINCLREIFARFGLPLTVVTDNGPSFKSEEFEFFLKNNGILDKCTSPYHPASNGLAERYVQTVKQGLRALSQESGDLNKKLAGFLMQYRKTPHSTTGASPAELLLKGTFRTRLDLVKRELPELMMEKAPIGIEAKSFNIGDTVIARFYGNKDTKWKFGKIVARLGSLNYEVDINGITHRRHVDQLQKTDCQGSNERSAPMIFRKEHEKLLLASPDHEEPTSVEVQPSASHSPTRFPSGTNEPATEASTSTDPEIEVRRSTRIRKVPTRLNL